MKNFSFYIVADPHYFSPKLKAYGKEYDKYMANEQKCLAETDSIISTLFDKIADDQETDTIIIPGDLVKNGEKQSHIDFIKHLNKLKSNGKKIYVLTAGHDYNDSPVEFDGAQRPVVEGTKRNELFDMYNEFGFSEAISCDKRTLSYTVQINEGLRAIMINCDGKGGPDEGTIDDGTKKWILEQIQDAKRNRCDFFAVTHYPIIPAVPLFDSVGDTKMHNWKNIAEFLADNGVKLIFTGHMHLQSIKKFISEKGNVLYDVCTSSVVGCPSMYRKITIETDKVKIESIHVPDFEWEGNTVNATEYIENQFDRMISNAIDNTFAGGSGFEGFIKKRAGNFIKRAKVSSAARLFFIKADPSIKDMPFKTLLKDIVKNIFKGDEPYTDGTPVCILFEKLLRRLNPLLKKLVPKIGNDTDIRRLILDTIGNNSSLSDNNEILPIRL